MKAKIVTEITVIDPDTNLPVEVTIIKENAGGMFGVDSSFLSDTDEPIISPFGNGKIKCDF